MTMEDKDMEIALLQAEIRYLRGVVARMGRSARPRFRYVAKGVKKWS